MRTFFILALIFSSHAFAASWIVDTIDDTASGSGMSGSLRYCIDNAANGDTIDFDIGGSTATITLTGAGSLLALGINQPSLIIQNSSMTTIYISGNNAVPIFYVASGANLNLSGVVLTDGLALGGNGGEGAASSGAPEGGAGGGGAGLGGALFIDNGGSATVFNIDFISNVAMGGTGGSSNPGTTPGLGGGGGAGGASGSDGSGSPVGGGGGGGSGWGLGNGGGGGGQASGTGPAGGSGDSGDGGSGGTHDSAAGSPTGGGGGGGASPFDTDATAGGFGGGGGGGGSSTNGENGGFGGGGGGAKMGSSGSGGFGGGAGAVTEGGGGAAFGGAIFVVQGGSLTFGDNVNFSGNNVSPGSGGGGSAGNGSSDGNDLYINSGGTLTFTPTVNSTFSAEIAGDTQNPGGGVVFNATSPLTHVTLSATNEYGGSTTITQGNLEVNSDDNLGASTTALVLDGGTLLTTGTFTLGAGRAVSTDASSSVIDVADGTSFTINQNITGSGAIRSSDGGMGTLYLGGMNAYMGGTTINSGTLSIVTDLGLGDSNGSLTLDGGTLQVTGASVLLSGTRTMTTSSFSSGIDVADMATFTIGQNIGGGGGLTMTSPGNGTLVLSSGSGNAFIGGLTIDSGVVSVAANNQLGDPGGALVLNGGTLTVTDSFSSSRAMNVSNSSVVSTVDIASGKTLTFSQGILDGGVSGGLNLSGMGTLLLEGTSTYSGDTTIHAGTLALSGTGSISSSNSLSIDFGATFDITAATSDVYINDLSGSGDINAEFVSGPLNLRVTQDNNSSFDGDLSGSNVTFILSGFDTLDFSGSSNSYAGGNIIQGGELKIGQDSDLGTGSMLQFNGGGLGAVGTFSLGSSSARVITVGSDSGSFDVRNGYTLTVPQNISGVGTVYVDNQSDGTLVFSSGTGNSFEGGLVLVDGILQASQDNQLGAAGGPLTFDGGTLALTTGFTLDNTRSVATYDNNSGIDLAMGETLTIQQAIGGSGGIKVNPLSGTGTLELQAVCTYTGPTIVEDGTLILSVSGSIGDSESVAVDGTLDFTGVSGIVFLHTLSGSGAILGSMQPFVVQQNSYGEFSGSISGIDGLTKEGSEELFLTGTNTYTGGTFVDGGTLGINSDASLGDTSGLLSIGDGTLYVNNSVVLNLSRAVTLFNLSSEIRVEDGATFTIAQAIADGGSTGGLTLTSDGAGILLLGSSNTYSGGTSIDSGTLSISGDGALGEGSGFLALNGGVLKVTSNTFPLSASRAVTTSSFSGGIDIAMGQTLTINQAIADGGSSGGLTLNPFLDTGTLVLGSACTYTGPTTIDAGTLVLSGNGSIQDASETIVNGTLDVSAVSEGSVTIPTLSGSGSIVGMGQALYVVQGMSEIFSGGISGVASVVKQGPSTLTLTGMNSYDTGTTIESGILQVSADSALGNPMTGFVEIAGGTLGISGSFELAVTRLVSTTSSTSGISVDDGFQLTVPQSITGTGAIIATSSGNGILALDVANDFSGGLKINSGVVRIEQERALGAVGGNLTLNGGVLLLTTNSVTLDNTRTITLPSTSGIDVAAAKTLTITQGISGGGGLNVNPLTGTGTLLLTANCSYTGPTTVDAGTLTLTGTGSIADSTSIALVSGSLLDLTAVTASVSLNNLTGGGNIHLSSAHQLSIHQTSSNEYDGVISGAAPLVLASGNFTLTLTNANTFSGPTTINAGTIALTGIGSIADSSGLEIGSGATLDITGISGSTATVGSLSGAGEVSMAGKTFYVEQSANSEFTGSLSGSGGALTLGDSRTLTLNGADLSYTGATTIIGGTLALTGMTTLSNSSATLIGMGTVLDVSGVTTSGVNINTLSGAGSLIATGQALTINQSSDQGFSGSISGIGASLFYTGGFALTLSGSNTFNGATEIGAGTLALSGSSSLAGSSSMKIDSTATLDTSAVTLMGGAFVNNLSGEGTLVTGPIFGVVQTTPETFSGNITGSALLILQGSSTLTLSGSGNSYTGGTEIQGGILSIASDVLGDTSGSLSLAGGTLQATGNFSLAGGRTVTTSSNSSIIDVAAGEMFTINQAITDGISQGGLTVTSSSTGTLILTQHCTYHGPTTISSGKLALVSAGSLLNTASVTVASGATLDISLLFPGPFPSGTTLNNFSGAGTLVLGIKRATLNQTSDEAFSGTISGSGGSLLKTGPGRFDLTGTLSYNGITIVQEGILALNTSVVGNVSVDSGGTLLGVCTIGGNLSVAGRLAPGNSPGAMTIMGDLYLYPGSETDIAITPLTSSEIIVTGSAILDGSLVIAAGPGIYLGQTQYTILTAEGSITPGFTSISGGAPGSELSVIYNPHSVILTYLTQLRDLTLTGNAKNFINYLNQNSSDPALTSILTTMALLSPSALKKAAIVCTPARNATASFASQNTMFAFTRSVSNHMGDQRLLHLMYKGASEESAYLTFFELKPRTQSVAPAGSVKKLAREEENYTVWIDGFTEFSHQKAQHQVPAFDIFAGGFLMGVDAYLNESGEAGAAIGFARNTIHEGGGQGKNHADLLTLSVYGTVYLGPAYIEMALWGTYNQYQTKRSVAFPGFSGEAKANFRGAQATPHLGVGYDFSFSWGCFEPFAMCDWVFSAEEHYQEHGAAPLNMSVKGAFSSMLRFETGLNCYQNFETAKAMIILKEMGSYVYKHPYSVGKTIAAIVGAEGTFFNDSFKAVQSLFSPSFEIFYKDKRSGLFSSLLYEGEFGSGYIANEALVRVGKYF
jgi:autotransporter-associated beta strand protein